MKRKPVTVGDRVVHGRKALGMTQLELAAAAGIRPETVSRIEGNKNDASLASLHKLCPILGFTLDELVHGKKGKKQ
jgi:transcriptional regulator with XRE-family HTH domain